MPGNTGGLTCRDKAGVPGPLHWGTQVLQGGEGRGGGGFRRVRAEAGEGGLREPPGQDARHAEGVLRGAVQQHEERGACAVSL